LVEQTTEMRGFAETWRGTPDTVVHSSGQEATPELADRTKRFSCQAIVGIEQSIRVGNKGTHGFPASVEKVSRIEISREHGVRRRFSTNPVE
jgi:hypothetical protein